MDFDDIPAAEDESIFESTNNVEQTNDFQLENQDNEDFYNEEEQFSPLPDNNPGESSPVFYAPAPPVPSEPYNFSMPEPEREEDALTKFNKEWNIKLEAKRAAEFEHEKAARAKAQSDLENWTTQRSIRMNAKKDTNRTEEHVVIEAIESESDNLKTWDRVTKLIDAGEVVDPKATDTSRMRKLFIQLKNEPLEVTRAASAVGGAAN
eukprot:gene32561-40177_t